MVHRLEAAQNRFAGPEMWLFAIATVVLASGAILIIMWSPKALALALFVGLSAVVSRTVVLRIKATTKAHAEGSTAVANAGLALAAVAVAPLLAFALLWATLLALLGATWLLHLIGIV